MSTAEAYLASVEPGKAAPLALLVIALLAAATVLLYRSMSKQLRKVPKTFDRPEDEQP